MAAIFLGPGSLPGLIHAPCLNSRRGTIEQTHRIIIKQPADFSSRHPPDKSAGFQPNLIHVDEKTAWDMACIFRLYDLLLSANGVYKYFHPESRWIFS